MLKYNDLKLLRLLLNMRLPAGCEKLFCGSGPLGREKALSTIYSRRFTVRGCDSQPVCLVISYFSV